MKPRTFARRPSSIGSNQLSKSRPSASPARADVKLLIMAWSPSALQRRNQGCEPEDYATQFQPPPRRQRRVACQTRRCLAQSETRVPHPCAGVLLRLAVFPRPPQLVETLTLSSSARALLSANAVAFYFQRCVLRETIVALIPAFLSVPRSTHDA